MVSLAYVVVTTLFLFVKCDLPVKQERGAMMPIYEYKEEYHIHYASFNIPIHSQKSVITVDILQSSTNCTNALITCALNPLTVPWLNIENIMFEHLWIPNVFYKQTFSADASLKKMKIEILQPKAGKWYIGCTRQTQENVPKYINLIRKLQGALECYYLMSFLSTSIYEENVASITELNQPYHFEISPSKMYSIYKFQAPLGTLSALVSLSSCDLSGILLEGCLLLLSVSAVTLPAKLLVNSTQFTAANFDHVAPYQEWNYIRIERPVGSSTSKHLTGSINISIKLACKYVVENSARTETSKTSTNSTTIGFVVNSKNTKLLLPVSPHCWLYSEMFRYKNLVPGWSRSWQRWTMHHSAVPSVKYFLLDSVLRAIPLQLNDDDMSNALRLNLEMSITDTASSLNQILSGVVVRACISRWLVEHLDTANWKMNCEGGWLEAKALRASLLAPHPAHGWWYLLLQRVCKVSNNNQSSQSPCPRINVVWGLHSESCPNDCSEQGECALGGYPPVRVHVCRCFPGFVGPDCSKEQELTSPLSSGYGTLRTVLLTTSNVAFLPAVVVALKRRFFVNALVYAYTMFFSTVYHLCDEHRYCLITFHAVATADFFGALLSIFVTAVSIAHLPRWARSLARIAAALGLVVALQVNRTSTLTVAIIVALASLLVAISWVTHCRRKRVCFPKPFYLLSGLLPGGMLALIAAAVFILVETNKNYGYTHSAWHILIALSVAFLLPSPLKSGQESGRPSAEEFDPVSVGATVKDEGEPQIVSNFASLAPEADSKQTGKMSTTTDTSISLLAGSEEIGHSIH